MCRVIKDVTASKMFHVTVTRISWDYHKKDLHHLKKRSKNNVADRQAFCLRFLRDRLNEQG